MIWDFLESGCFAFGTLVLMLIVAVGALGYYLAGWTGVWWAETILLMMFALGALEGMK